MLVERHPNSREGRYWIHETIRRASTWRDGTGCAYWEPGGRWAHLHGRYFKTNQPQLVVGRVFPYLVPVPASCRFRTDDELAAVIDAMLADLGIACHQYLIAMRYIHAGWQKGRDPMAELLLLGRNCQWMVMFAERSAAVAFRLAHVD